MEAIHDLTQLKTILKKKGWKSSEISATVKAVSLVQKKRVGEHLNHFLYWSSLLLIGLTNIVGIFSLFPALLLFEGMQLNLVVAGSGVAFGILFNYFIRALEHLERKHHIIAGIFIPIVVLLDVFILLGINEFLRYKFNATHENMAVTIILFVVGFLVPYGIFVVLGKHTL